MATPTLVQITSSASSGTWAQATTVPLVLHVWLPNPTRSGNALVMGLQADTTGTTAVISDDQTNSWSTGPTNTSGQVAKMFYKLNAAANTRHIQVSFTGATPAYVSCFVAEFCNVATSGTSTNAAGATLQSGTVAAGSFTPPSANDLVVQFAIDESAWPATGITGFTAGTGFTKLLANRLDGIYAQYQAAPGGALNPSFTVGGSTNNFQTLALSLPGAAAGTPLPSTGMYVIGSHHYAVHATESRTAIPLDIPLVGDLMVAQSIMFSATGGSPYITSITDSRSATYNQVGSFVVGVALDPLQTYYARATGNTDTVVTINLVTAQNGGSSFNVLDITGSNTSPLDTYVDNTGNQIVTGNLTTSNITPTTANGIVVGHVSINAHTISGALSPAYFLSYTQPDEDGGSNPIDQDNGWSYIYNPSTAAQTFSWSVQHNTAGVQTWGAKAVAFKANVSAPVPQTASIVQSASAHDDTGANSPTITATINNVVQGRTLVVHVGWLNPAYTCTVSDGIPYAVADPQRTDVTNGMGSQIFYLKNAAAGTHTITATFSSTTSYRRIRVIEIDGLDTVNPLDVATGQDQFHVGTTTDAISSGASSASGHANNFVVGFSMMVTGVYPSGSTVTAGTGYTLLDTDDIMSIESKNVYSTGAQTATFTQTAIQSRLTHVVAFKMSDLGVATTPSPAGWFEPQMNVSSWFAPQRQSTAWFDPTWVIVTAANVANATPVHVYAYIIG